LLTAPILALDAVRPSTPTVLNKSAGDPFDGDVRLSKYYARIIRDGRFLRILAGIDSLVTFATKSYRRVHVSASGSPELSHPV
jgi:hypothetical protein